LRKKPYLIGGNNQTEKRKIATFVKKRDFKKRSVKEEPPLQQKKGIKNQ